MSLPSPATPLTVVVVGTGGTIAGQSASAADNVGYRAGTLGVDQLVKAVPQLAAMPLECRQVAQLDSKDMDVATWLAVAHAVRQELSRDDVAGIVVTHGTDTLEETALFLQRVLAPSRPVAMTAAMRPASSLQADGPQNLCDAVAVARCPGSSGVVCVAGGRVMAADDVRKLHPYRLDAFSTGDDGDLARIEEGVVRPLRAWPRPGTPWLDRLEPDVARWPWVEVVHSHAGARGDAVDALVERGVAGIVVAATGNGTVHRALDAALARASARGVRVVVATRCIGGGIVGSPAYAWPHAGSLTPAKARVALLLELLQGTGSSTA